MDRLRAGGIHQDAAEGGERAGGGIRESIVGPHIVAGRLLMHY